ncbi:MAG: DUF4402 domain-containing protein, partial [Alphaproteobacteria bacterium]|nr:DUF4402 domain-containing protein [Alphaproteobacteria bacterium]
REDMNLGTYVQTASRASGILSYNSSTSGLNGLIAGSSSVKAAATIRIKGSGFIESVRFSSSGSVVLANTPGCTITVSDFTFSRSSPLTLWFGSSQDINIGATVTISGGFCGEGNYHGTGAITYGNRSATQNFDIEITLETPLSIEETQGMNFGTFLSPNMDSTIVLSPSGTYTTTGNIGFVDSNLTAGEFTVTGIGSRQVSITLPGSTTLSNGSGQTMTVNSFTSNPSESFTLSGTGVGKTQTVKVGSTLHVNKNQKSGNYTGTYPIIVSY